MCIESSHIRPQVIEERLKKEHNSFKIICQEKTFFVDPVPAIQYAKIIFEAYEMHKIEGQVVCDVSFSIEALQSIIGYFHGLPLIITESNINEIYNISTFLGIPSIQQTAKWFLE